MEVLLTSIDNPYVTKLGGKHIHLLNLEAGLKSLGVGVIKLYYDKTSIGERFRRASLLSKSVVARNQNKIMNIADYLRRRQPIRLFDIVHAHDVLSLDALSGRRERKVLTMHGYFARENIEYLSGEHDKEALYPFYREYEERGVHCADHIIAVDTRLRDYVVQEYGIRPEMVTVLFNAIDVEKFRPINQVEIDRLRTINGLGKDRKVILVPRRLVEKNGVVYAARAMKYLDDSFTMLIVGDGPERGAVEQESEGDPRIVMLGEISHDRIIPYYQMADVVLVPSVTSHGIQEATSLSMLEGMACGKPTVCSNIGGMREIIKDGENGFLVNERDPESFARKIDKVLSDNQLLAKVGNRAREYVVDKHSYLKHAESVLDLYRKVLGGKA